MNPSRPNHARTGVIIPTTTPASAGCTPAVYVPAHTTAAGGTYDDTEGLINLPLTVKEIQASVFFKALSASSYRVSLRSKGAIDVASVARRFGGGGHRNAAGCTVPGDYATARAAVLEAIAPVLASGLAEAEASPPA